MSLPRLNFPFPFPSLIVSLSLCFPVFLLPTKSVLLVGSLSPFSFLLSTIFHLCFSLFHCHLQRHLICLVPWIPLAFFVFSFTSPLIYFSMIFSIFIFLSCSFDPSGSFSFLISTIVFSLCFPLSFLDKSILFVVSLWLLFVPTLHHRWFIFLPFFYLVPCISLASFGISFPPSLI